MTPRGQYIESTFLDNRPDFDFLSSLILLVKVVWYLDKNLVCQKASFIWEHHMMLKKHCPLESSCSITKVVLSTILATVLERTSDFSLWYPVLAMLDSLKSYFLSFCPRRAIFIGTTASYDCAICGQLQWSISLLKTKILPTQNTRFLWSAKDFIGLVIGLKTTHRFTNIIKMW